MFDSYKSISVLLFGNIVDTILGNFESLVPHLRGAGIKILLKTWICIVFFSAALAFFASLFSIIILGYLLGLDFLVFLYILIFIPILAGSFTFLTFYLYPIQKSNSIKHSIENDLPFALSHMAAIASSGIPIESLFDLLTGFKEYGAISREAELIIRNIEVLGMSSVTAIKDAAKRTPSVEFKRVLLGITSTVEKGGDLVNYLRTMSDSALFLYKIKREKYLKTLSTYADIYTALLVAAPLILLSVLGILSIIGGDILGLDIQEFITLITFLGLPTVNIGFLAFIHMTYPQV